MLQRAATKPLHRLQIRLNSSLECPGDRNAVYHVPLSCRLLFVQWTYQAVFMVSFSLGGIGLDAHEDVQESVGLFGLNALKRPSE